MNKYILWAAIINIVLHMTCFITVRIGGVHLADFSMIIFLYYLVSIPVVIYQYIESFKTRKKYTVLKNSIGAFFTLPFIFILPFILPLHSSTPQEIDPSDIHVYDSSGNEIPADSILKAIDKEVIDGININEN